MPQLAEARRLTGADLGAAVFLDAGRGVLEPVAADGPAGRLVPPWDLPAWLSSRPRRTETLLVPIPDLHEGLLVLLRGGGRPFTSDEQAVAQVLARRFAGDLAVSDSERRSSLWARQLEAIQRIGARLARLASVEEVGQAVCTETRQVIEYHNCRVYAVETNGLDLTPVAFRGDLGRYEGETADALGCRVGEVGEGLTGWVAARGEAILTPDAASDPRAVEIPGTDRVDESMLLVPMRFEGRVTGVIVLSKLGLAQFDGDDLRLLQIIADQAAVAIENARLLEGREAAVVELETLLEMVRTAAQMRDVTALADALAGRFRDALGLESCLIWHWDPGAATLRLLAARGVVAPEAERDLLARPSVRHALAGQQPLVLSRDDEDLDAVERRQMDALGLHVRLLLPLSASGEAIGLAELAAGGPARGLAAHDLAFAAAMAAQAGPLLENAWLVAQLRLAADLDQLTGVANHRALQERLRQELARAARSGRPLAVAMIDLDGFKAVNDRHGHAQGDHVLREVAGVLRAALREPDVVARYGGDEFVVLMPDTDDGHARQVLRRVGRAVAGHAFSLGERQVEQIGASAGLALYPRDGVTPAALLAAADRAMYAAKRGARAGAPVRRERPSVVPRGAVVGAPGGVTTTGRRRRPEAS
ncbi:MAG: diguanylate cyclase [Candidatus Limnocylindrales bacterium]